MSTPTRELPPLRVSIIGDNTSFTRSVNTATQQALNFQRLVQGMTFTPNIAPIRRAIRLSTGAAMRVVAGNVQSVTRQIAAMQMNARVPGNVRRVMRTAITAMVTGAATAVQQVAANLGNTSAFARFARQQLRQAVRTAIQGVAQAASAAITQGLTNLNTAALSRSMTRAINRALNRGINRLGGRLNAGPRQPGLGRQGVGGRGQIDSSGMAGFGNRADIYMHAAAIRNLVTSLKGVVGASAAWQDMSIQMEVFTGSATKAADTMKQIQTLALISPYSMATLGDAARTMMSYGVEAAKAMGITRSLADVAGGSAERMHRLAYAMGQISSVGHLTGMELRQLTEVGFNPMMTMAKEMATDKSPEGIAKQYAILDGMKKKHMITTDMVVAALKQETQQGGRFAGMMNRMSQTMSGLSQQAEEYAQLIGRHFMDTLREDIENALRGLLSYLKAAEEWVRTHKEATKEIAQTIAKIVAAIAAFHAAGFAIALVMWNVRSLIIVLRALRTAFLLLSGVQLAWAAVTTVCTVAMWLWNLAAAGWLGTIAAVSIVLVGLPLMIGAIALALHRLSKGFDMSGVNIKQWAENAKGFMWNFGHNMQVVTKYVKDNWDALTTYMGDSMRGLLDALPGNLMVALKVGFALIASFMQGVTLFIGAKVNRAVFENTTGRFMGKEEKKRADKRADFIEGVVMAGALKDMATTAKDTLAAESKNIRTGMENVKYKGPDITGLKLDSPEFKFPKAEDLPIPPKDAVDYAAMLGKGSGGKAAGISTAVRANTSSHAEQIYNTTRAMQARAAGANGPKDPQLEANRLLKAIEKNTRDTAPETTLEAANLYGMTL